MVLNQTCWNLQKLRNLNAASSWLCFGETLQVPFFSQRARCMYTGHCLTVWKECSGQSSSYSKGKLQGNFGVHVVGVPASTRLFISDIDSSHHLSLLFCTCLSSKLHICPPLFPGDSPHPCWCDQSSEEQLREGLILSGTSRLSQENVEVGDRKHPCATQASKGIELSSKASDMRHDSNLGKTKNRKKRQTSCIPEPIPQSTITSLNSSTLDGGARAHPVVLAALPAPAAQSVFLVAMATGKLCAHAQSALTGNARVIMKRVMSDGSDKLKLASNCFWLLRCVISKVKK